MFGIVAEDFDDESVKAVESVVGEEHEGTFAGDDFDAVLAAEVDRRRAHCASVASGAVHPDAADAGPGTVCDDGVGDVRRGHEQRAFDGGLDVLHTGKTESSEHGGGFGIDGDDVVSAAREFVEEHDAEVSGIAGEADHRDALGGQERFDGFEGDAWSRHVRLLNLRRRYTR